MTAIATAKKLAAIFLLAALFLPLSQCTVTKPIPGTRELKRETTVTYAYTSQELPSLNALAVYAAFLWPAMFIAANLLWPALNRKLIVGVLEVLLCFGSGYMLVAITLFSSLRYGGYIAWGAIGTYCIGTCIEVAIHVRTLWRKRLRPVP